MPNIDALRAELERYKSVALSEVPRRLLFSTALLLIIWSTGQPMLALVLAALTLGVEAANLFVVRRQPAVAGLPPGWVAATLAMAILVALTWAASVIALAIRPEVDSYVCALLFATMALLAASGRYANMPTFALFHTVPAGASILVVTGIGWLHGIFSTSESILAGALFVSLGIAALPVALNRDLRAGAREMDRLRAESLQLLERLHHASRHDRLTDLLNRSAFDEALETLIRQAAPGQLAGVIMVDLNGFKPINDAFGHDAGDAVLVAVADQLRVAEKDSCKVARLGGDEFALLLHAADPSTFAGIGQSVIDRLKGPIPYQGRELRITASVGIATTDDPGTSLTTLCSRADQAMYRAKTIKARTPVLFDPAVFGSRLTFADKLTYESAIRDRQFRPVYQRKIRLDDGQIVGFEALARWDPPEAARRYPADFLPDIEELGLLLDFSMGMLRQILIDVSDWLAAGLDPGQVAFNLPETVLATGSAWEDIEWLLAEYPRTHPHLVFEITEDVFIARSGDIIKTTIARIRSMGIAVSLDDFGTGYASFQHLRELEFDEMKIDNRFISGLGQDPMSGVIVDGFMSIAHGLGVKVVGEGVETEAQAAFLRERGCHFAHGFLFGEGLSVAETTRLIEASGRRLPTPDQDQEFAAGA